MSQGVTDRVVAISCEASDVLDPNAQLIELAAVTVQHGRITGEQFHALLNPQTPIPRSGTVYHGHSQASLADCPVWRNVAAAWMAHVQGAQLMVWNANFHLRMLDRAQRRAGLPTMHTMVAGITDLRELLRNANDQQPMRRQDALNAHGIHHNKEVDLPMASAHALAQLWLTISDRHRP
jgi:DNA polymerase-3 subunit epsilon